MAAMALSVPGSSYRVPFLARLASAAGLVLFAAMASAQYTPAPQAEAPARVIPHNHIYSETADPTADIAAALRQARREHKRVILDFGGDWCGDCQVLDLYFHQPPNAEILARHYIVVHVFIGHMDQHVDVAEKYNVPLKKGVPALAVLDAHGTLLYSQTAGEFERMRSMDPGSVTEFLKRWKA
jgi:thiol:disulfide interchange protein